MRAMSNEWMWAFDFQPRYSTKWFWPNAVVSFKEDYKTWINIYRLNLPQQRLKYEITYPQQEPYRKAFVPPESTSGSTTSAWYAPSVASAPATAPVAFRPADLVKTLSLFNLFVCLSMETSYSGLESLRFDRSPPGSLPVKNRGGVDWCVFLKTAG